MKVEVFRSGAERRECGGQCLSPPHFFSPDPREGHFLLPPLGGYFVCPSDKTGFCLSVLHLKMRLGRTDNSRFCPFEGRGTKYCLSLSAPLYFLPTSPPSIQYFSLSLMYLRTVFSALPRYSESSLRLTFPSPKSQALKASSSSETRSFLRS